MKTNNLIHFGGRIERDASDVLILKADLNYTFIYFKDGTRKLVATTLGKIEGRLPARRFFRINRSTVVNLDDSEIASDGSSITTKNGMIIHASRRRKEELLAIMKVK